MSEALAITNVKVFDGNALTEERTVVIDNGVISAATTANSRVQDSCSWLAQEKEKPRIQSIH